MVYHTFSGSFRLCDFLENELFNSERPQFLSYNSETLLKKGLFLLLQKTVLFVTKCSKNKYKLRYNIRYNYDIKTIYVARDIDKNLKRCIDNDNSIKLLLSSTSLFFSRINVKCKFIIVRR